MPYQVRKKTTIPISIEQSCKTVCATLKFAIISYIANATRVLKIDPRREKCMYIGPKFDGLQKWFGGVLGFDGMVYGIPQNASGVLKINPFLQECTVIGELGNGMWKWHGGTAINGGKQIIGYPNNADSVLVIDVEHQKVFTVGDKTILKSGRHRIPQDGRYKW